MSDLETVARWLGAEYSHNSEQIQRLVTDDWVDAYGKTQLGNTYIYLDPDQELGAILRRAAELNLLPSMCQAPGMGWQVYLAHQDHAGNVHAVAPTPLAAARAAVCKLVGEAK
jgi:hypothetical protein